MTGPWCPWYEYRRSGKNFREPSCHNSSSAKRWDLQYISWAEKQWCWGIMIKLSNVPRSIVNLGSPYFLHSPRWGSHVRHHRVDTRHSEWVRETIIWYQYPISVINHSMLATTTWNWRTGLWNSSWMRLANSALRPGVSCWRGQRPWSGPTLMPRPVSGVTRGEAITWSALWGLGARCTTWTAWPLSPTGSPSAETRRSPAWPSRRPGPTWTGG